MRIILSFGSMQVLAVQLRDCRFSFSITLLALIVSALNAQSLSPTPGFLQDVAGQFPFNNAFSLEQQIQIGAQETLPTETLSLMDMRCKSGHGCITTGFLTLR